MSRRSLYLSLACLIVTLPAFSQGNPTGKLAGRAYTAQGEGLPGVTVTVSSPNLQGQRNTVTSTKGEYLFAGLPAGDYTVSFQLEGFGGHTRYVKVAAAQTQFMEVEMTLEALEDEIVVLGRTGTISETTTSGTNYKSDMIEELPVARTIEQTILLAPGVAATGPTRNGTRTAAITISGSQSFENLFLINGVPVNENVRGQGATLFIEDAIQETTVGTAGVSAEYGRFTGGVVNTITKSGGNEIHGSLRDNFTNEVWSEQTPIEEDRRDKNNQTLEGTLGGYFIKDRIWFFGAGRDFDRDGTGNTNTFNQNFETTSAQTRLEGKLTFSLTPSHSVLLSSVDVDTDITNDDQGGVEDPRALTDSSQPQESLAANYTGILSDNFLVEAQFSNRELRFEGTGGTTRERTLGTPIIPLSGSRNNKIFNPLGSALDPEIRKSDHTIVKGSYFLTTESTGAHDLVFGVDTYTDRIINNNFQSSTDFDVWSTLNAVAPSGEVVPIFFQGGGFVIWRPIFALTRGTDFESRSAYINDRWQLNDRWSFNLGLRFDENDGRDADGNLVTDDTNLSPRLGASYDVKGDGDWIVHATAGRYTAKIAGTGNVADAASAGGAPAFFGWLYLGPNINTGPVPDLTAQEALEVVFNWFDSVGGTSNRSLLAFTPNIPGLTTVIEESLDSPNVEELTVGFTKRLGNRGILRADYINREFGDFYFRRIDETTGQVADPEGSVFDRGVVENNDDLLERKYDGLQTQFTYRVTDRLNVGGNWTWSHARGNFDGEGSSTGPVASRLGEFPQYRAFEQHNPRGDLGIDQRHQARGWMIYDVLRRRHNSLSVSLLQSFRSGTPYGAAGSVDPRPFVENPGFVNPPGNLTYFFTAPDAFTTDDVTSTSLSVNYSFLWNVGGRQIEVFVQPEVLNVFDEDAILVPNTTDVRDATTDPSQFQTFNPFTDPTVQGVHFDLGPNFATAQNDLSYQTPRTFRFSVGLRF